MNHPVLANFKKVLESDYADFFLNQEKDTLITKFKESTVVTSIVAEDILKSVIPFKNAGSKYSITELTGRFITITKSGKKYFNENISPSNTKLVAIIVGDSATKMLANVYARFDKPRVHTRVFVDFNEAIEWIEDMKF